MPEIEINYKPKVFNDPEFCEKDAKECKFLDTGCCILFDEPPIFKPGEYYHKHQQCKDYHQKSKRIKDFKDSAIERVIKWNPEANREQIEQIVNNLSRIWE